PRATRSTTRSPRALDPTSDASRRRADPRSAAPRAFRRRSAREAAISAEQRRSEPDAGAERRAVRTEVGRDRDLRLVALAASARVEDQQHRAGRARGHRDAEEDVLEDLER